MKAKAKAKAGKPQWWEVPELWGTDGNRVWRGDRGPTVCLLGDPRQPQLFDDADTMEVQLMDAQLISCAPRLRAALLECARRLESCCHFTGTQAEYARLAVQGYRDLIAESFGKQPDTPR